MGIENGGKEEWHASAKKFETRSGMSRIDSPEAADLAEENASLEMGAYIRGLLSKEAIDSAVADNTEFAITLDAVERTNSTNAVWNLEISDEEAAQILFRARSEARKAVTDYRKIHHIN